MICETCHGAGHVPGDYLFAPLKPCPDCGGSGIAHCCEGERPRPDEDEPT